MSKSLTSLVAVTDSGKMFQYDPKKNFELVDEVQAHNTYILRVKLSPDDRFIATTSADGTAQLWLADGLEPHASLREHEKWVWDCDFSADSDYCITASSDSYARLWDVETGKLITVLKGHHKVCMYVCCIFFIFLCMRIHWALVLALQRHIIRWRE